MRDAVVNHSHMQIVSFALTCSLFHSLTLSLSFSVFLLLSSSFFFCLSVLSSLPAPFSYFAAIYLA